MSGQSRLCRASSLREHREELPWRPPADAWTRRDGVADLAVAVIDDWQGRRPGTRLAIQAIQRAKQNGFSLLTGTTFWDNRAARRMMRTLGFDTVGYDGALPDSPGVPAAVAQLTLTVPFNDLDAVTAAFARRGREIAASVASLPFVRKAY